MEVGRRRKLARPSSSSSRRGKAARCLYEENGLARSRSRGKEGRKEGCGQSMPGKKKGTANAHVKSDENGKRMRPSNYRTGDGELQSGENDLAVNYPQVSGVCVPARLGRVLSSAGGRAGGRASDDAERKKCSPRTVAHLKHGDATAHDPRAGERGRLRTRSNLPIRSRSPSWLKRPRPGPAFRVW